MKRIQISPKLYIIVIILLSVITLLNDVFNFYSSVSIKSWDHVNEAINASILLLYYFFLRSTAFYRDMNVRLQLKRMVVLLTILYMSVFLSSLLLSPSYSLSGFPRQPQTISTVIYSNIITWLSIAIIVPLLVIVRNLIFYKRKHWTSIYIVFASIAAVSNIVLVVVYERPPEFTFTGVSLYTTISYLITIFFFIVLATRNSWISQLFRNEKYTYFFASLMVTWVISYLFDFGFKYSLPVHSLFISAYTYISWSFLMLYSTFATVTLLIHLPTARIFDRKMKEVSSLHDLSRAISGEFNYNRLVKMVTEMGSDVTESTYTWLELYDEEKEDFFIAHSVNLNKDDLKKKEINKNDISNRIFTDRKAVSINEISKTSQFSTIKNWKDNIESLAGAPIITANGTFLGILYAAKKIAFGFNPDDLNMLEAYANQAAIAMENARLVKNSLEKERLEQELLIARNVQLKLLPQELPQLKNIEFYANMITAYEVGGDYYDFFSQKSSSTGLVIGDVSGKGTSAAFYMAETKGVIQSLSHTCSSPKEILISANKILFNSLERKSFISIMVAMINTRKKELIFSRAGHSPLVYYSALSAETILLEPKGLAVGLDSGKNFERILEEQILKYNNGDVFVFYTDGLTEARNRENEEFGENRLSEIVQKNGNLGAKEINDKILDEIMDFLDGNKLQDDLTMIVLKT
jgi:serine phosphatase RsbU (regulator of sigma subunit)